MSPAVDSVADGGRGRLPHESTSCASRIWDAPVALWGSVALAIIRLAPHYPNMTPLTALGVYAGARLRFWTSLAIVFPALIVTDVVIGCMDLNAPWNGTRSFTAFSWATPFVYLTVAINVALSGLVLRRFHPLKLVPVCLFGSLQFFVVTNFAAWLVGSMYPHTFDGLVVCYAMGLPFLGNQILGDLCYTGAIFAVHAVVTQYARFSSERFSSKPSAAAGDATATESLC